MTQNANATQLAPFRGRGRLQHVVQELRRQVEARVDFVVDTRQLAVQVNPNDGLRLVPGDSARDFLPSDGVPLLDQALVQLGEKATPSIPIRFLRDAARESPNRIADYMTGVMHDHNERRLVRVLDGKVRAFLSDTYRPIESLDVIEAILRGAQDHPVRVLEASISDSHMRIKLISPSIWAALDQGQRPDDDNQHRWLKPGDRASQEYLQRIGALDLRDAPMQAGDATVWPILTGSNSETGHGRYLTQLGLIVSACLNLAIHETMIAQVHLGSRLDEGIWTPETIRAEARAIELKARDVIALAFTPERFKEYVAKLRAASANDKIEKPVAAMAAAIKLGNGGLRENDLDALVRAYSGEEPTVWGIGQAIARFAQDTNDPEVADEREQFAGAVLAGKHTRALLAAK